MDEVAAEWDFIVGHAKCDFVGRNFHSAHHGRDCGFGKEVSCELTFNFPRTGEFTLNQQQSSTVLPEFAADGIACWPSGPNRAEIIEIDERLQISKRMTARL